MRLENYISGKWVGGSGDGVTLTNPVTGESLVTVCSDGVDLEKGLAFAREQGTSALQQMSYAERANKLAEIADVLTANKAAYYDISLQNSGSKPSDAAFDVDGAIFTLKSFARAGKPLGSSHQLLDGQPVPLSRENEFMGQHFLQPLSGVAVFINAFNFPAWGLWEKAAPALLSGMSVLVKPATPTAWLTQRMVEDVVKAGILPDGALNIVCGKARDLLDYVQPNDVVSFTGSAETAARVRTHPKVVEHSVRLNIEADSVNALVVGPEVRSDQAEFSLAVREVVNEMSIKSGQKCTAIRRIFVPAAICDQVVTALKDRLGTLEVGNLDADKAGIGPLVNNAQVDAFEQGLQKLKQDATVVFAGSEPLESEKGCFAQPTLLLCEDGLSASQAHDVEVFGPLAVLFPYRSQEDLQAMLKRGQGSLVVSVFSSDQDFLQGMVPELAKWHGRIMVVNAQVGKNHTGHGNVMPNCLHGGPGRAGGGEELGGLRALALYHRRYVVQGPPDLLATLSEGGADTALIWS